jgi:tRNA pseudouridine38-40 synthase
VQGVLEAALRQVGWQGSSILAAGRTDTGVHASGQVVAFDLEWKHSAEDLCAALNANLPPDVAARSASPVEAEFHPRYAACARRYLYRIYCQPRRDPLRERYSWRVWPLVEVDHLQATADQVIGTHDFAAYGASPRPGGGTIRTVFQAGWQAAGEELDFEIQANAFLYRMVRRLVFAQVAIGQNGWQPEVIWSHSESLEAKKIRGLAPPQGLALAEVYYIENPARASATPEPKVGDDERG